MKIILVGYMGCGKSTIGKELSKIVRIPFYDLDEIIQDSEEESIKNIFSKKGEIYFRKIESLVFRNFINNNESFILALGGGTPCYGNNHEILQQTEIHSFYLKGTIDTLTKRLSTEMMNRPLIAGLSELELKDYIAKHLFDRSYYYLQSKVVIAIDTSTIAEICKEINDKLA
jgi:shikimate kinase